MSAMYRVSFKDGTSLLVHSADARSAKAADVRAAYRKARLKAVAKRKAAGVPKPVVSGVSCVG